MLCGNTVSTDRKIRLNNYDLLRIISTIAVIFIHVNYLFFKNYSGTPSLNILYIAESLINIITRFSVPVFVMISGAFNLSNIKNTNANEFYKKTIWKIFIPCIGAIILFFIYDECKAILDGTSIMVPIKGIIAGNYYNLWFVYMLAGLYLLTPLIVKLKQVVSKKTYMLSSVILMIWSVGSQAVSSQRIPYALGVVFAFLGYYILGDVILNNDIRIKCKSSYFTVAFVMFLVTFFVRSMGVSYYLFDAFTNFFSPTIVIASICIFAGFKQIDVKSDLSWLSGKTFYIYLFHTIIYKLLFKLIGHINGYLELIVIPTIVIITFVIALGIAIIYDKFWKSKEDWKAKWYSMKIWM